MKKLLIKLLQGTVVAVVIIAIALAMTVELAILLLLLGLFLKVRSDKIDHDKQVSKLRHDLKVEFEELDKLFKRLSKQIDNNDSIIRDKVVEVKNEISRKL